MNILLVDDAGYTRMVVKQMLENLEHRVWLANNGQEALGLLECEEGIDIVITDYQMPGMNGLDLFTRAKEYEHTHTAVFILLTASPDREVVAQAKQIGFYDILVKPLDNDRLMKLINKIYFKKNIERKYQSDVINHMKSLDSTVDSIIEKQDFHTARVMLNKLLDSVKKLKSFLDLCHF